MEADWEVEIGHEAPVIDVYWEGVARSAGGAGTRPAVAGSAQVPATCPRSAGTQFRIFARLDVKMRHLVAGAI